MVGRALGAVPSLVGVAAGLPVAVAGASVASGARLARSGISGVLAAPAVVARDLVGLAQEAVARGDRRETRRVWTMDGRAHIEVFGLEGSAPAVVTSAVEDAVKARNGVAWVRVDAVTRRAVIRFDPAEVTVQELHEVVAGAEATCGVEPAGRRSDAPEFPGDDGPVRAEGWALAADLVGLGAAVAGRLVRLPALPGGVAAAVVLVDNQPRLRGVLESALGTPAADLVMAASNAAALALTQGTTSLVVDTGQRAQAVLAARARRSSFDACEQALWDGDRPGRAEPVKVGDRPVPLPAGPVEHYADRAAAGSLMAAGGLLAATRSFDVAGRAILIGAPKAARAAREAFADTLSRGLSTRGVLVMDPSSLRPSASRGDLGDVRRG